MWECGGIVCTGETYKTHVKLTFAHGAALPDPAKLFNASLDGGTRRAIDVGGGDDIDDAGVDRADSRGSRVERDAARVSGATATSRTRR